MIRLITIVILAAATFAPAQATTQGASKTRYAVRSIHINTGDFGFDSSDVESAAWKRASELAPRVLQLPDAKIQGLSLAWMRMGQRTTDIELIVNLEETQAAPAAKEFADQWADAIADFIKQDGERRRHETLEPLERGRLESSRRLDEAQAQVADLRAKMRQLSNRADVSVKSITDAVTRLEEERQRLELDVMGKSVRREALEKEIAGQNERIEKKINADPIADELQKVVDSRSEQIERVKKMAAQNVATESEVSEAVGRAAEARAKLLERKRDAAAEAGGESMAALNRELLSLSIDLRELEARLGWVKDRLPGLLQAMDQVDELERALADMDLARNELTDAERKIRQFNLSSSRMPQVSITAVADRAEAPKKEEKERRPPAPPGGF